MEGTREDKLAKLRMMREEKDFLIQKDRELANELVTLENEEPAK